MLVQHAYVIVGDQVFRQCRGIPMGINSAVYLANCYLFMYELRFVQQLLHIRNLPSSTATASRRSLALQLLQAFCWTVRYIDDIWSIVPRHSTIALYESFLYVHQCHDGISGVCPSSITISSTSQPNFLTAKYMSLRL